MGVSELVSEICVMASVICQDMRDKGVRSGDPDSVQAHQGRM